MGIKEMLQEASVIVMDGTAYRVDYCDDEFFMATLEDDPMVTESFSYDEVQLNRDLLYKLTLMNPLTLGK